MIRRALYILLSRFDPAALNPVSHGNVDEGRKYYRYTDRIAMDPDPGLILWLDPGSLVIVLPGSESTPKYNKISYK